MIYSEWEIRRQIVDTGQALYEQKLVVATDGNISFRLDRDRILITPSGLCLGKLKTSDIVTVNSGGRSINGRHNPSSELPLHLEVYQNRPEIRAVLHAHPPLATAFTVAGRKMDQPVLPEIVAFCGEIPTAEYATPSTNESAEAIRPLIAHHDVILLDHHGAITISTTLTEAFYKMERLEYAANVLMTADRLGGINPLSNPALEKLKKFSDVY